MAMLDPDALMRHYGELSDDMLCDALSVGPGAYQPAAWAVIMQVAAARGLRYVGPPAAGVASREQSGDTARQHPFSLKERIAMMSVLVVWFLLALNYHRGWHWFGDADQRVLEGTVGASILLGHWIEPHMLARLRAHESEKRARAMRSVESDRDV